MGATQLNQQIVYVIHLHLLSPLRQNLHRFIKELTELFNFLTKTNSIDI